MIESGFSLVVEVMVEVGLRRKKRKMMRSVGVLSILGFCLRFYWIRVSRIYMVLLGDGEFAATITSILPRGSNT